MVLTLPLFPYPERSCAYVHPVRLPSSSVHANVPLPLCPHPVALSLRLQPNRNDDRLSLLRALPYSAKLQVEDGVAQEYLVTPPPAAPFPIAPLAPPTWTPPPLMTKRIRVIPLTAVAGIKRHTFSVFEAPHAEHARMPKFPMNYASPTATYSDAPETRQSTTTHTAQLPTDADKPDAELPPACVLHPSLGRVPSNIPSLPDDVRPPPPSPPLPLPPIISLTGFGRLQILSQDGSSGAGSATVMDS